MKIDEEEFERLQLLAGYAQVIGTLALALQHMGNFPDTAAKVSEEIKAELAEMAEFREIEAAAEKA